MSAQAPSIEALRAAYDREKPHRPNWPATFEAAMADPLISRVLALHTRWHVPTVHRPAYSLRDDEGAEFVAQVRPLLNGRKMPDSFKMRAAGEKPEKDDGD